MDAPNEELDSAFASSEKKRKHDVCESENGTARSLRPSVFIGSTGHDLAINGRILDLTPRKDFGVEECTALGKLLSANNDSTEDRECEQTTIEELLMGRLGIGPGGGAALAESLGANQTVTYLDLERNGLGATGGCAIFRALAANRTLRKLNMNLNDLKAATSAGNHEATNALGDALRTNSTLKELLLVRSGLGPRGGNNLAQGLSSNTSLLSLDLAGNDVMADGGQAIGEALKTNATLKELNLRWNRIGCGGDRGIESLADSLRTNTHLQRLDMSVNELYSEGAVAFGRALAINRSLLHLSLERNEIGSVGATAIAAALKVNNTIEKLVLSGNPMMGDNGVEAIGLGLAENQGSALKILELVDCGIGGEGARGLSEALKSVGTSLSDLRLERNRIGATGCRAIAAGLEENSSLRHLNLARNGLQMGGGNALAAALQKNNTLQSLDVSNNDIEIENVDADNDRVHIVESVVGHPSLQLVNLSDNALEIIPIDCQLKLARIYESERELDVDLSDNPLSSPPLGRKANIEGLKDYLKMLLSESTSVNRIRLMVLGFGGVGKSTFCDAVTQKNEDLPYFHGSLIPLEEWDFKMIASWARRLGTQWAQFIGSVLETNQISGKDLPKLIGNTESDDEIDKIGHDRDECYPSEKLQALVDSFDTSGYRMDSSHMKSFARAIESLMRKGYFSTVGAVKMESLLELEKLGEDSNSNDRAGRACSLVDFAGQMEYLVSHQLLLSSLHTLCVVLQPAPSFGNPQSRHSGSWMYWSRFLRALGDRRRGSLLLAISQQDRVSGFEDGTLSDIDAAIEDELSAIRSKIPNITECPPLRLNYRPERIRQTVQEVRGALSNAADIVARDWWVPASYERLAELVRRLEDEKKAKREVPILSREELRGELPSAGLHRMHEDPQLFKRGIEYLEAVGDVMADHRLDCLLLDPISWFASFLAHFIRDDDIVTSVQLDSRFVKRGMVSLEDVVRALRHDYVKPREQVAQVMSLVCRLELCVLQKHQINDESDGGDGASDAQDRPSGGRVYKKDSNRFYLFPCLLPMATRNEIARIWPTAVDTQGDRPPGAPPPSVVYRGHRFRSRCGFFPPGLFPGLLARCRLLRTGVVSPRRTWKNCAVLLFGRHARVVVRIDLRGADPVLDVVGAAPTAEDLFVGAAKGQASVVVWVAHLVRMFLRRSYPQLALDESFLCPSAECNALASAGGDDPFDPCRSCYRGAEFPAVPRSGKRYRGDHDCEADGCWSQLGVGHTIEAMVPQTTQEGLFCSNCCREARFALRS